MHLSLPGVLKIKQETNVFFSLDHQIEGVVVFEQIHYFFETLLHGQS